MLFLNFSSDLADTFKSKYHDVATQYKGKGISFLLGDVEASQGAFQVSILRFLFVYFAKTSLNIFDNFKFCLNEQYFGLKEDQVPLIIVQTNDGQKYLKPNLEPDHIASWVKDYQVHCYSFLFLYASSYFSFFPMGD